MVTPALGTDSPTSRPTSGAFRWQQYQVERPPTILRLIQTAKVCRAAQVMAHLPGDAAMAAQKKPSAEEAFTLLSATKSCQTGYESLVHCLQASRHG